MIRISPTKIILVNTDPGVPARATKENTPGEPLRNIVMSCRKVADLDWIMEYKWE